MTYVLCKAFQQGNNTTAKMLLALRMDVSLLWHHEQYDEEEDDKEDNV